MNQLNEKIILIALDSPIIGFSQYVDMWHFSVHIYEATEKEWFTKVMSKAAENKL